jgi:hypothetical protein
MSQNRRDGTKPSSVNAERHCKPPDLQALSLKKFIDDSISAAKRRIAAKVRGPTDPPSLEALVIAHDGYDKIPKEAWTRFDREMAEWKTHVHSGEKHYRWKDI